MSKKAVLLELDEAQHAEWKQRAKAVDLTLSAWIRMKCSEETVIYVGPENPAAIKMETTLRAAMTANAVNESNKRYYHTAASNRHTCRCESCTEYRKRNDIPEGGFKK